MPDKMIVFMLIRFLHDLATVVWIGGLITMALAVLPAAKRLFGRSPQTRQLVQAVKGRLKVPVYASIVVLVATGALMSRRNPQFSGLFSWGNPYSATLAWKHVLVAAMVIITIVRSLAFGRAAPKAVGPVEGSVSAEAQRESTGPSPKIGEPPVVLPVRDKISMLLLVLNVLLGVVVVLLSALTAVLRAAQHV